MSERQKHVVLIDNDEKLLRNKTAILAKAGFRCSQINTSIVREKGVIPEIETIQASGDQIDLVLTDFHAINDLDSTDYSGFRIAMALKEMKQNTVIFSSEDHADLTQKYGVIFLSKMLEESEFIQQVNNLIK
ncbi:MAG TPA: hypothetical protein VG895_05495 [Patescibacteria group bacterium]|nr:hypothetical protein [Patescibacteria group bacterium]